MGRDHVLQYSKWDYTGELTPQRGIKMVVTK